MNVYIDICYKEHDQKLKKNSKKKTLIKNSFPSYH